MKNTLIKVMLLACVFVFIFALVSCGDEDTTTTADGGAGTTTLVVTFDTNGGSDLDEDEVEVEVGEKLPKPTNPTKTGFKFDAWYIDDVDDGDKFSFTKKITQAFIDEWDGEVTLVAKWINLANVSCAEGGKKHNLGAVQTVAADCTTAGSSTATCSDCQQTIVTPGAPALGHQWGEETVAFMCMQKECQRRGCDAVEKVNFRNLTTKRTGQTLEGGVYGDYNLGNMFNNDWFEKVDGGATGFAPNGSGPVTVTVTFKESGEDIDVIYVAGHGGGSYEVKVLYVGESEYETIGTGSFRGTGEHSDPEAGKDGACAFLCDDEKLVTEVVIHSPTPSNGTEYWDEICCAQIPN